MHTHHSHWPRFTQITLLAAKAPRTLNRERRASVQSPHWSCPRATGRVPSPSLDARRSDGFRAHNAARKSRATLECLFATDESPSGWVHALRRQTTEEHQAFSKPAPLSRTCQGASALTAKAWTQQARVDTRHDPAQAALAFDQRPVLQIFSVDRQHIERKVLPVPPEQRLVEVAASIGVETQHVPAALHQPAAMALDGRERQKAVVLQL
jgi:hypothetical protein